MSLAQAEGVEGHGRGSGVRGRGYADTWGAVQFEEQTSRAAEEENSRFASFRAAKVPKAVSDRELVFTPRRSNKPLTETTNIEFASDKRTQQRQAFDMKMAQKQVANTPLFAASLPISPMFSSCSSLCVSPARQCLGRPWSLNNQSAGDGRRDEEGGGAKEEEGAGERSQGDAQGSGDQGQGHPCVGLLGKL